MELIVLWGCAQAGGACVPLITRGVHLAIGIDGCHLCKYFSVMRKKPRTVSRTTSMSQPEVRQTECRRKRVPNRFDNPIYRRTVCERLQACCHKCFVLQKAKLKECLQVLPSSHTM